MMNEQVQQLRERVINGFSINRIPPKTKAEFIQFAEEEYCGDRGFALDFLWKFYTGVITSGIEHLEQEILLLKEEVEKIKTVKEEKKGRTMMNGRKVD